MSERIHVVVNRVEKERFRRLAAEEGKSLSEWLRSLARSKVAEAESVPRLRSERELLSFFEACDRRETGREPDWEAHLEVIEGSVRSGTTGT
jgi:hypothetical protein